MPRLDATRRDARINQNLARNRVTVTGLRGGEILLRVVYVRIEAAAPTGRAVVGTVDESTR